MGQRNTIIGTAAAIAVVFFWSGWILVSRFGVVNSLTPFDVAGLRFGVAGLLVLPYVILKKTWRGLTPLSGLVVFVGSGAPYAMLTYFGLYFAPAAHGGVFLNGSLPIFTALVGWLWLGQKSHRSQNIGLGIILVGVVLVGYEGFTSSVGEYVWLGDALLLTAICLFALFMVGTKVWQVLPGHILFAATVLGMVVYVPLWLLWLPSNIVNAPWSEITLQAAYQGLVPSILGISCVSISVRNIGADMAAVFMSAVPAVAALAAIPILGEVPGVPAWIGMVTVTLGILLALGIFRPKTSLSVTK